ncbi:MAG: carboxypeptidase regulatory-like domain-containing protein [Elusimicrobia bacterium]|nr:carboxypeptidase regulatory-like domain-containing protein [Elusimicrobiota bacterium]
MMSRSRYLLLIPVLALAACKGGQNQAAAPAADNKAAQQTAQSPVDPATAGSISGTVKFTGAAPKMPKINMSADAYCKTQHTTDVFSPEVVVNPNNTLKWVYVYVKSGLPADMKFPAPTTAAVFDQNGCMYNPHVLAVQAGQQITIRNSDGVLHNIDVRPAANQGFNVGQPVKGMETQKSFTTPEVMIPVKCDVHPWMAAFIGVQNHPYAAVTDDNGAFSLANLPPGTYTLEAWHEKYGTATQEVTVGPKETKTVEFEFKG